MQTRQQRPSPGRTTTPIWRGRWRNACALVLFPLTLAWATACSHSNGSGAASTASGAAATDSGDPPARVARLGSLSGDVSLEPAGDTAWSQASQNYPVTTGDRLYTDPNARAELDVGGSAVRLDQKSDLTLTNLTDHFEQVGLDQGTMSASLYQWNPADSVELDTPNGALMPLAAGTYRVTVDPSDDATYVTDESGSLQITAPGVAQTLQPGQTVELTGSDPVQISTVGAYAPTDFDRWVTTSSERFVAPAPTLQYVNEDVPGWEDLDEYGNWVPASTTTTIASAPAWCPTHLSSDWVPYRDGHWTWVDPWGWTWVDNQPWGFATTHYGRWTHASCGWAWEPGPENVAPVYAPALVAFLDGATLASELAQPSVQAWFPLAPDEPFFPWYHHSDTYLRAVNFTNLRNAQNLNQIIQAQNIANIRWANRAAALTAVPAAVVEHGEPVMRAMVRVRPALIASAPLEPHLAINPDPRFAVGGRRVTPPPVMAARPLMVARAAPGRGNVPNNFARTAPPNAVRPGLESRSAMRGQAGGEVAPRAAPNVAPNAIMPGVPRAAARIASPARVMPGTPTAAPRAAPRALITRNPAPPQRPSFAARQPAMQAHPGRPLEPQQVQNLRAGRPAGPMHDVEVPNHGAQPAPAPRAAPPQAVRVAPPSPTRVAPPTRQAPAAAPRPAAPPQRQQRPPSPPGRGKKPPAN